eukprot:3447112-Alexandrium_andersonii.AAC.1
MTGVQVPSPNAGPASCCSASASIAQPPGLQQTRQVARKQERQARANFTDLQPGINDISDEEDVGTGDALAADE